MLFFCQFRSSELALQMLGEEDFREKWKGAVRWLGDELDRVSSGVSSYSVRVDLM